MGELTIESLGLSREEIIERVVERVTNRLLSGYAIDEDGEEVSTGASVFGRALEDKVIERANAAIENIAAANVLPNVASYVENLTLQETNKWGERTQKPLSFTEYLVQRAEAYLTEKVNYEGKGKTECGSFSFSPTQTRISHLVEKHLHYRIESAMKDALATVNSALAKGITETVKIKLEEVTSKLRVEVKTK